MVVTLAGTQLVMRADKTLYWPHERVLFVADVHLGKGTAFRAAGIPVPRGSTGRTLDRLAAAVQESGCRAVVILGDLWHCRQSLDDRTKSLWHEFQQQIKGIDLTLVMGNHDARAGRLPESFQIRLAPEGRRLGPFCLCHHPVARPDGYVLAGHVHPAAHLSGKGRQTITLPAFWFEKTMAVLPAFGEFTGSTRCHPSKDAGVYAVAGEQVVCIQALRE